MRSRYSPVYDHMVQQLIAARMAAGMTQLEAATRINAPQSRISRIESGERRIDVAELIELADLYGVTLEEIIGRK